MKNIAKLIAAVLVLGTAVSCDPESLVYDAGDGFVQFNSTSGAFNEAGTGISQEVSLGLGENTTGVTVNFSVSSSDNSRFTVEPASGALEIPAGSESANITVTPIDNLDADGNLDITITIESVSGGLGIGVDGAGTERTSTTLTLQDNDCVFTMADFAGNYTVAEQFTDGPNAPLGLADFFAETYEIIMTPDPTDTTDRKLVITNAASANTYIGDGTVITLDASASTCVGPFSFDAGDPVVALFTTFTITSTGFDTEARTFQADGPLANFGDYQFIFTKK